ncbi:uncharacterized protein LOC111070796 isoform X2 [Drosophila obscura]|uniref:uncharacterized protein LOC111070796 isoform X2 n=1 Tax=Drosophila obscura TaxID=7282 RepID=UPI001BB27186|nr:uncharacterized protein LOC111070796 isoform X2 [Drosophila obscura]
MPERAKELHATFFWTQPQTQSQIQNQPLVEAQVRNAWQSSVPCCNKPQLSRNKLQSCLVLKKEVVEPQKHQEAKGGDHATPNCNKCPQEQRVKPYSGYPLNVKLYMPTTTTRMPSVRSRSQATTTTISINQPAMHRKSKSKSKSVANSTFLPFQSKNSLEQQQPFTAAIAAVSEEAEVESDARTSTELGANRTIKQHQREHPDIKNTTRRVHNHIYNKNKNRSSSSSLVRCKMLIPLPTLGATSFVTLLTLICIETVLLSTMSSCAKTFYMHWNTSNSIFRIDNTDHIIDVNKGNLAFEFDQVHIICPVYEPGTFENETEKYIIYNVSKVEYETCRITNADPRVIAICDKPQKLMFFTITFRPFTPQPGGLEFLPGNDYYFISTSSKDDLYRRIGGRCSTNNMKVVFKVCCATEEKNKTTQTTTSVAVAGADTGGGNSVNIAAHDDSHGHGYGHNTGAGNTIGISGVNGGLSGGSPSGGIAIHPNNVNINGLGTSINTNIDQFNRIPIQPNIMGNNVGSSGVGGGAGGGIILSPGHGHGSINMLPPGRGGVNIAYPGHHHIQTGIRINNVPTQHSYPSHKGNVNGNSNDDHHHYDKHPNEVVKNEELTYNSGSAIAGRNNFNVWIWISYWLPLPSPLTCCMSGNWLSSSLVSIFAILAMHQVIRITLPTQRFRPENMAFSPSSSKSYGIINTKGNR